MLRVRYEPSIQAPASQNSCLRPHSAVEARARSPDPDFSRIARSHSRSAHRNWTVHPRDTAWHRRRRWAARADPSSLACCFASRSNLHPGVDICARSLRIFDGIEAYSFRSADQQTLDTDTYTDISVSGRSRASARLEVTRSVVQTAGLELSSWSLCDPYGILEVRSGPVLLLCVSTLTCWILGSCITRVASVPRQWTRVGSSLARSRRESESGKCAG